MTVSALSASATVRAPLGVHRIIRRTCSLPCGFATFRLALGDKHLSRYLASGDVGTRTVDA
jgi:hypothetical protein